jgi:hypothetical protein
MDRRADGRTGQYPRRFERVNNFVLVSARADVRGVRVSQHYHSPAQPCLIVRDPVISEQWSALRVWQSQHQRWPWDAHVRVLQRVVHGHETAGSVSLAGLATVDMHLCLPACDVHSSALLLAWPQWTCTSACTRCAQQHSCWLGHSGHAPLPARDVHSSAQSPSRPMCQQVHWPVAGASAISGNSSHHAVSRGQQCHVLCHTSRRATPGMRAAIGFSRCTVHACSATSDRDRGHSQQGATVGARGASTTTCARRQDQDQCMRRQRQTETERQRVSPPTHAAVVTQQGCMPCTHAASQRLARHPRSNTMHTDPGVLTMCCVSAPLGAR